ncbi:MAG TPA: glutamate--tRNA ligase [Candidatus Deferrimicrobiaceae bacterium]|nr:glutamate--tRNA ligase [Candidatus Deferrimicrobiaceae bacterium]
MSEVVTRFAPSPTGFLHIGGARTALFNWLFARRHGGKFLLRIEDTDKERSTPALAQAILDGLEWLGLSWDEGPFFQMERIDLYRREADRLLAEGKAYRCVCTPEDLDSRREAMKARGEKPRYDGRCRNLRPSEAAGKTHVLRFRAPSAGKTVVTDLLRGEVTYDNAELDDLVLVRSDGSPTYNFVVVVDDAAMGITHVLRGDDHLNNTPKQILIYEALGYSLPKFGHFPLIHGIEGGKMSKRQDDVSVQSYRERGYLPEAMVNYLVRLGWGHGDQEIFSMEEMQRIFSLENVGKSPSRFDPEKLLHLNAHYIKTGDPQRLAGLLVPFLRGRGIETERSPWLAKAVRTFQERSKTLAEMAEASEYYFRVKEPDPKTVERFLTKDAAELFEELAKAFAALDEFTPAVTESLLHHIADKRFDNLGKVAQPIRVALTGGTVSPGIFEVMDVLGREEVIRRLTAAAERIRAPR